MMKKMESSKSETKKDNADINLIWIHCNKCFEIYNWKNRKFLLLSCLHVLCETCLIEVSKGKGKSFCPFCKALASCKKIEHNSTSATVQLLFKSQPWKTVPNMNDMMLFQEKQRGHLQMATIKFAERQKKCLAEVSELKQKCRRLQEKNKKMMKKIKYYEEYMKRWANDSGIGDSNSFDSLDISTN